MSEEKPQGLVKGIFSGWVKAGITGVLSLLTGAGLMALRPVVSNAIKPALPLVNFGTQVSELTATFNNRSTGAVQGWWDFGDGTPLEPFDPQIDNVKHVYPKPGNYAVKLSLKNVLGEEADRTVQIAIDAGAAPLPVVESFKLTPVTPPEIAPVVYRLEGKVKNATHCVLCLGDDRPIEITDASANQERYVTFEKKGTYTIRLAAVSGKQLAEKSQTVSIQSSDRGGRILAKLRVPYHAVKVERTTREWKIYCGWKKDAKGETSPIKRERLADPDCTIVSAELVNDNKGKGAARNVRIAISPDRKKATLIGELVQTGATQRKNAIKPAFVARIKVVQERRSPPQVIDRGLVMMAVNLNTTTKLPMQKLGDGWEIVKKKVYLELWESGRKAWEGSQTDAGGSRVTLKNQTCMVTATPQRDGFLLRIEGSGEAPTDRIGPVIRRTGFERYPLVPKR